MATAKSQSISFALHILTIAMLLLLTSGSFFAPPAPTVARTGDPIPLAPFVMHVNQERGGGSNTSKQPARRGVAPPRSSRTFIPPVALADPKLPMTPTIDYDVPLINVASTNYGDPLSKLGVGLYGDKGGDGIGDSPYGGSGIGPNKEGRPGLSGRIVGPTTPAQVIHQVDPEFSEDARKAKYQGVVVLMIEVGVDGRAHNPKVVEHAGLGLDEKALEAVSQWRFRPAQRGGQSIVSTARVEVHFHLM
jgi:TonB family protein